MKFAVELTSSSRKALSKIDPDSRQRIAKAIDSLASNPRPRGAIQLAGSTNMRIRVGDWRVVYVIEDSRLMILVVRVGHRSKAYRA